MLDFLPWLQVWFRVNEQLPVNLQKSLPDRPPELPSSNNHEGDAFFWQRYYFFSSCFQNTLVEDWSCVYNLFLISSKKFICSLILAGASMSTNKSPPMPRRNPPPPPSSGDPRNTSQPSLASRGGGSGGALGAFWSTQHAKDSLVLEEKSKPMFDEEPSSQHISLKHDTVYPENDQLPKNSSTNKVVNTQTHTVKSSLHGKLHKPDTGSSKDFEINFFQDKAHASERRMSGVENTAATFDDRTFNTFVAEFDSTKFSSGLGNKSEREEALEAEVEKLKGQLKEAKLEKVEITSKYEKLSAICRSQRQELQELKQALAARTPSPSREGLRTSPGITSSASAVIAICNFLL